MGKQIFFIGDVHGCLDELEMLLDKAGYHGNMRLIFVGDLINKGPDSQGVLRLFRKLGAEAVQGNHERGFIKYVRKGLYGKPAFDDLIQQLGPDLHHWVEEMESWPLYIKGKDWLCVHAGLQPGVPVKKQKARILTKIRTWDGVGTHLWEEGDPPWHALYSGKRTVIYGHWATAGLVKTANTFGLDSACLYGGHLTGLLWPQRQIIQVPAKRAYVKPRFNSVYPPKLTVSQTS